MAGRPDNLILTGDKNIRPFGWLELLKIYLIDSLRWCQSFTLGLSSPDHRTIRGRFSFPARRQNMSQVTIWWDARESRPTVDRPDEALLRIWAINSRAQLFKANDIVS